MKTGEVLQNRYRIVKKLDEGGFGAVYRAWDANLNLPCAIKRNFDSSPEAQAQFLQEARMLASLSHPNLVRVIDHFILPGQGQCLVMNYVEGEDLQAIINREGQLPVEQVLIWTSQICDALIYLHRQQPPVIHRDIKPGNIRITPSGDAVLVDFGIAKVVEAGTPTRAAARAVTSGFSPYEQYGNAPTDARTDIYALGATIYCLLTGEPPEDAIDRVARPKLTPPSQVNPTVSPALDAVLKKALAVMPADRWQTISPFKQALTGAFAAPVNHHAPQTPAAQPGRSGRKKWLGLVVGGLVLAALAAWLSLGGILPTGERGSSTERAGSGGMLGDARLRESDGMLEVYVPAGTFRMGSDVADAYAECLRVEAGCDRAWFQDEEPPHQVYLKEFWIDRTEVTNAMFAAFLTSQGNRGVDGVPWLDAADVDARIRQSGAAWVAQGDSADHPVTLLTWHGAGAYCAWVGGRLPSEAEWEKAARGADGRAYPWGAQPPNCDWAQFEPCDGQTIPVGSLTAGASPFGALDMAGNAWEWVADWHDEGYYASRSDWRNPTGPPSGEYRVVRGGSWISPAYYLRASNRNYYAPDFASNTIGFRCARDASP